MSRPIPGGQAPLAGRHVARIGYGAMQLERSDADRHELVGLVRAAVELGVDHVDTAEFYGAANDVLREALRGNDHVVLATKVGADRLPGGDLVLAQRPEQLRASLEDNLRSLGRETIDVVNLRRGDRGPGLIAQGDQVVDLDVQLDTLIGLRDEGKLRAIGLSAVSAAQLRSALPAGIACVQNAYSLVDRAAEPVLGVCRDHGIPWVPFFPLGSAFPGHPKVTDLPAVRAMADARGATPAQIGLAWLLATYGRTLLIPGTANLEHLRENLAAGDVRLDAADMTALVASPFSERRRAR